MSGRIFVLIFFFWAVLTIVTPALILLSESSKPDLDFHVENIGVKDRKMIGYQGKIVGNETVSKPMEAPAPAPLTERVSGTRETNLTSSFKRRLKW